MEDFKDQKNKNEVIIHLATENNKDFKYLRLLLSLIRPDKETMTKTNLYPKMDEPMNTALCNIIQRNDKMTKYLTENHRKLLSESMMHYLYQFGKDYDYGTKLIPSSQKSMNSFWIKFIKLLFDLLANDPDIINGKLIKILTNKYDDEVTNRTLICALFKIDEIVNFFINTPLITDKNKNKLFGSESDTIYHHLAHEDLSDNQNTACMILKYYQNNSKIVESILFNSEILIKLEFESLTLLEAICQQQNIVTLNILNLLMENENIVRSKEQWKKLLTLSKKYDSNVDSDPLHRPFWSAIAHGRPKDIKRYEIVIALLNRFKGDTELIECMLGTVEMVEDNMYKIIEKIKDNDSSELIRILLHDINYIPITTKYWFFADNNWHYIFHQKCLHIDNNSFKIHKLSHLMETIHIIIKYFADNDKELFIDMLNDEVGDEDSGWTEYKGNIIHWICECKNTKLLNIILNCQALTDEGKYQLLTSKDDEGLHVMDKMSAENIEIALKYVESKQMNIRKLLFGDGVASTIERQSRRWNKKHGCPSIMAIFKYFNDKGDKALIINQLLNEELFPYLFHLTDIMQFIFNESILSDKDILNIFKGLDWKNIFEESSKWIDKTTFNNGSQIFIKYLESNGKLLWNMLMSNDKSWIECIATRTNMYSDISTSNVLNEAKQAYFKQEYQSFKNKK